MIWIIIILKKGRAYEFTAELYSGMIHLAFTVGEKLESPIMVIFTFSFTKHFFIKILVFCSEQIS